jgi:two-component system cell cycle sensor histidine kinase/response regulator CckA
MPNQNSKTLLRILHLDDDAMDHDLVTDLFRRSDLVCELVSASNAAEFESALKTGRFDLVISDYAFPAYDGFAALAAVKATQPDTPFIVLSGTIGEERAVEILKQGATDYVLKDRIERLIPVVRRALGETAERAERKRAERRGAVFSTLGEKLSSTKTAREAAEIIVKVADQLSPWDSCSFSLYNEETDRVLNLLNWDIIDGQRMDCPTAQQSVAPSPLARRVIDHGAQLTLRERSDGPPEGIPFGDRTRSSASLMFAPIRHDGKVVGILSIQSYRPYAYGPDDLEALQSLADHCAGAMIRIQAAEALRESDARFREMLENLKLIAMTLDKQGCVTFCNDYLLNLTDWKRSEVLGFDWFSKFIPTTAEVTRKLFFETIESGPFPAHHENPIKTRNGNVRDIVWNNTMLRDVAGKVIGVASIGEDVTERRQLEAQLRQSQKMEAIGQLAGGVAHDFNNLLTVILCNVEMLLASEKFAGDDADALKDVVKASQAAAQLTRQLMIFSRKQTMQSQLFDLNEIVGNLIKMLRRVIGEHISLEWHPGIGLPRIKGDPGMIEQVIMNLAVNARDAMPKDGELFIETKTVTITEASKTNPDVQPGDFICLTVRDTGCGIPSEILPRIFEPFFTTKEIGKGTGLGLATVFGIVKQHRGWMEVESKVDRGTTFRIYLSGHSQPTETISAQTQLPLIRGGQETILLVEDEPSLRVLARRILQRHGYTVFEATSGLEAQAVWREQSGKVDLLLTDMVMPDGLTGRELAERLRAERPGLKVIYSSGYSSEVASTDFISRPDGTFLAKPYEPQHLAKVVRNCLDNPIKKNSRS